MERPGPQALSLRMFLAILLLLLPCARSAASPYSIPLIYAVQSPPGGRGELDSVALWINANASEALLFVTDKTWNTVEIHDAITNTYLGRIGSTGSGLGQMLRPNGVVVLSDLPTNLGPRDILLVTERDNDRVSAWLIPYMYPLGSFGAGHIYKPYGITLHVDNGVPQAWVTSTGHTPDRVVVFDLSWSPQTAFTATHNRSFAVPGSSVLESLVIDPVSQRALVCDESNHEILVYDLQGNLQTKFGLGYFADEPEGIAIYDTGNGNGYIVVADQQSTPMEFEVFDRETYARLGSVTGPTSNTDGLTLMQTSLSNLPDGALFAIHNDRSLHTYDWADIANALGLCINTCAPTDAGGDIVPSRTEIVSAQPNPFNPATTIRFSLAQPGAVVLRVFDLQGRLVRTLDERPRLAGDHAVTWLGDDNHGRLAPAGIYFVQLRAGGEISTNKITLVK